MESVVEVWRPVQGYSEYEVSNMGRVKSLARTVERSHGIPRRVRERILIAAPTPKGYLFVSLYRGGKSRQRYVHHLVAEAFIGERPAGCELNHKDLDKSNNTPGNLEYGTHNDNMQHAIAAGVAGLSGEKNYAARYTPDQIRHGYSLVKKGMEYKAASIESGVSQGALESACRGINWKCLGLKPIYRQFTTTS